MTKDEFENLRREVRHLLTCVEIAEDKGALLWAKNLRTIARYAASISDSAKVFEERERRMDWRPAAGKSKKQREATP